jgi:hypothetical protein
MQTTYQTLSKNYLHTNYVFYIIILNVMHITSCAHVHISSSFKCITILILNISFDHTISRQQTQKNISIVIA